MSAEWPNTSLDEVADLQTGFPFASDRYSDDSKDIRLLRGDNIVQGKMRWDGVKRWDLSNNDLGKQYMLEPGDVVLAMDRPWIGAGLKYATLTQDDTPALLVQRVARLRTKGEVSQRFLGYLIRSREFTEHVLGVQTGTAVPHISPTDIKRFTFRKPPLREQERVAELLGAFDDKLENNRQMAESLNGIAQTIFQSWFVDFDPIHYAASNEFTRVANLFPDHIDEGGLPERWAARPLGEITTTVHDTLDPASVGEDILLHFSLPAYDAGQQPICERASVIKSLKLLVNSGTILFSKLNPQTPRVWVVPASKGLLMVASTEFLAMKPADGIPASFLWALLLSPALQIRATSMVTGTSKSHQRVQPSSLMKTDWLVPPVNVLNAFDLLIAPMMEEIEALGEQSNTLIDLRDTLLPQLLSGELRVQDIADRMESA